MHPKLNLPLFLIPAILLIFFIYFAAITNWNSYYALYLGYVLNIYIPISSAAIIYFDFKKNKNISPTSLLFFLFFIFYLLTNWNEQGYHSANVILFYFIFLIITAVSYFYQFIKNYFLKKV